MLRRNIVIEAPEFREGPGNTPDTANGAPAEEEPDDYEAALNAEALRQSNELLEAAIEQERGGLSRPGPRGFGIYTGGDFSSFVRGE